MSWYRKITNNDSLWKSSSVQGTIQYTLQLLNNGADPSMVSSVFINRMKVEDPTFDGSLVAGLNDADSLRNYLQTYGSSAGEQIVDLPPLPQAEVTPGVQQPEIEQGTVAPDETIEEDPDSNEVTEEGIIGKEEVLTNQIEAPPNFEDRVTTDPTLLETFELPVAQISTIRNKLAKINNKLRQMFYPEIKIEFIGDAYEKAVKWQNRVVKEPYIQVRITGTMPSPSEEIMVKKQERVQKRDGTWGIKTTGVEPKGVRLIAKIIHNELSEAEQAKYLQTLPENSPLRKVINEARARGDTPFFNVVEPLEGAPPIQGKFWYTSPQYCMACKVKKAGASARKSTYIGAVVPPERMSDKTAIVTQPDGSEKEITLTRKVKNKKTGELEDQTIKIIKDEDVAQAAQEQFGGKCIDPFDAVKTITALKNWVKNTKKAKEEYEKKKSKSKHKGGGWGSYPLPTNHLLAVAVNLLREPRNRNNEKYLANTLAHKTRAYTRSLKEEENPDPKKRLPFNIRNRSYTPRVVDEDKKIASDAADWWRGRLGALDLEPKDRNKISLSVLPTTGTTPANMRDVLTMVEAYITANNIDLQPLPPEAPVEAPRPQRTILDEPVEPVVPETPEAPGDPIAPTPANAVDISTVREKGHFVSKLRHKESAEWRRGGGTSHYFLDDAGKKYVIFDKYKKDSETGVRANAPSMNFNQGEDYYIEGDKGVYNSKYRTTVLNNASVANQGAAPEAAIEPEAPGLPEAVAPEAVAPEAVAPEAVAPEVPSGLPSWYGKYDLGQLVVDRISEGIDPDLVISKFLDSMAMISDKFKDEKFRRSYETVMKRMWRNEELGGKEALFNAVKGVYKQFKPKLSETTREAPPI